jgi:sucrose phosphorylase
MTFFNFTASHDGVGVRPLEGLVSQSRFDALVESVRQRGGRVSTRSNLDGSDSPYELNVTYFSALDSPEGLPPELQARKFLVSQGVMLALAGIPGIYFQSLVGAPNYLEGVQQTGQNRTINRRKFDRDELEGMLSDERSASRLVFDGYRNMLKIRTRQPAFHPDAEQTLFDTGHKSIVAFTRKSVDGNQRIVILANVGDEPVRVDLSSLGDVQSARELLRDRPVTGSDYQIDSYDIAWVAQHR